MSNREPEQHPMFTHSLALQTGQFLGRTEGTGSPVWKRSRGCGAAGEDLRSGSQSGQPREEGA